MHTKLKHWVALILAMALPHAAVAADLYASSYSFAGGTDGASPSSGLVAGSGTLLYGTTLEGGLKGKGCANGCGTLYSFNTATKKKLTVYNFTSAADGAQPTGPLAVFNGYIFGATAIGGANGFGTIYEVQISTGKKTILHSFTNKTDGGLPTGVARAATLLYATTSQGTGNVGSVVKITPTTAALAVLHDFTGTAAGSMPAGTVTYNSANGAIYGTTQFGGAASDGALFQFIGSTAKFSLLHSFTGDTARDGAYPAGTLLFSGGLLYGASFGGGGADNGVIYSFNPTTAKYNVLYHFTGLADGANPNGGLALFKSALIATTPNGGTGGGTLVQIATTNGAETTLHSFGTGTDGSTPNGDLLVIGTTAYGTTQAGGAHKFGTIFTYN